MAAKKKAQAAPPVVSGETTIFKKAGRTGHRIAVNLSTGVVIEEDGKTHDGKENAFFLYVAGRQFPITSDLTLEEIAGAEPDEEAAAA